MKTRFGTWAGLVLAFPLLATAQEYSIPWFAMDAGGGTSMGGGYVLAGSIGQTEGGISSSDDFTFIGGFWAMASAVQTPGAPLLRIRFDGTHVIISWPASVPDFQLQETSDLVQSKSWSDVLEPVHVIGEDNVVRLPARAGMQCFRLFKR